MLCPICIWNSRFTDWCKRRCPREKFKTYCGSITCDFWAIQEYCAPFLDWQFNWSIDWLIVDLDIELDSNCHHIFEGLSMSHVNLSYFVFLILYVCTNLFHFTDDSQQGFLLCRHSCILNAIFHLSFIIQQGISLQGNAGAIRVNSDHIATRSLKFSNYLNKCTTL